MLPSAPGGADVRLPLAHLFFGLLASVALAALLLFDPALLQGPLPGSDATLVATHLFTLGWVTVTTMGAMLMIVPVSGVAPPPLGGLTPLVPLGAMPGVLFMLYGFGVGAIWSLALGGTLLTLAGIGFLSAIWRTARHATVPSPTPTAAAIAAGFFLLTALFGLTEALNFAYGFWNIGAARFWGLHAALGGMGWVSLAIIGVSYKLVQMFTLSHAQPRFAPLVIGLWSFAALWVATGALCGSAVGAALGFLPAIAAYVLFLADMRRYLKARQRLIEPGIRQVTLSWISLGALLVLVPLDVLGVLSISPYALAFLFAFGWAGANLWGFLYKIAPFLIWFHRYAEVSATQKTPALNEMAGQRWLRLGLYGLAAGTPLGFAGALFALPALALPGQLLLLLAALSFLAAGINLARHFFGRVPLP